MRKNVRHLLLRTLRTGVPIIDPSPNDPVKAGFEGTGHRSTKAIFLRDRLGHPSFACYIGRVAPIDVLDTPDFLRPAPS